MTEGVQEHRRAVGEMTHKHTHTHTHTHTRARTHTRTHTHKKNLNIHMYKFCFSELSHNCLWSYRKQRRINDGVLMDVSVFTSMRVRRLLKVLIGECVRVGVEVCVTALFYPAAVVSHLLPSLRHSIRGVSLVLTLKMFFVFYVLGMILVPKCFFVRFIILFSVYQHSSTCFSA